MKSYDRQWGGCTESDGSAWVTCSSNLPPGTSVWIAFKLPVPPPTSPPVKDPPPHAIKTQTRQRVKIPRRRTRVQNRPFKFNWDYSSATQLTPQQCAGKTPQTQIMSGSYASDITCRPSATRPTKAVTITNRSCRLSSPAYLHRQQFTAANNRPGK